MDADRRVLDRAAAQHGVITTEQALQLGLSRHQLAQRVRSGVFVRVHRGVQVVAGAPRTDDQRAMAAVLGSAGVASHRTGMRLWDFEPPEVLEEVSVVYERSVSLDGVVVHRSKDLHPDHVSIRRGIPVTNPLRLLADLGAVLPWWYVERCLDDGIARRLFTPAAVVGVRWELSKQGRIGLGALQAVLDRAELAAPEPLSVLEAAFSRIVRRYGLPVPVLQHPVVVDGRRRKLDAAWPEQLVAVEVDGFASRVDRARFQDDRTRQNGLVQLGWTVLRFTWTDVVGRPEAVGPLVRRVLCSPKPLRAA